MTNTRRLGWILAVSLLGAPLAAVGCGDDSNSGSEAGSGGTSAGSGGSGGGGSGGGAGMGGGVTPLDPDEAPLVSIDRFSDRAGTLMVRDANNGLPEADEAIDFDVSPFITTGLGPDGKTVRYYNFDVMPTKPAPIFALFREGEDEPVAGQLNVVGVIPGDVGYSDFWHVHKVTVPETYEANTLTSVDAIMEADYPIEVTDIVVNCPVVPDGSTASLRLGGGATGLTRGWYEDQVVTYFEFGEASLTVADPDNPEVPLSPIYVTFNENPDQDGGGPPSGFVTEEDGEQTHNVVATVPGDDGYSPLWMVNIYDNADFDAVADLQSAESANILAMGAANVNCPIVDVE